MNLAIPGTPGIGCLYGILGRHREEEYGTFSSELIEQGGEHDFRNLFIFSDSWANHPAGWMIHGREKPDHFSVLIATDKCVPNPPLVIDEIL